MNKKYKRGVVLLDVIVSISIVCLLLSGTLSINKMLQGLSFRLFQDELYSLILSTRHYSIANKRKPLILKEGNWIIVLDDDKQYKKIHIPQNIDCEMPKKLGFTDSGIIRFSGSLKCKSNKKQFRISLGIGSSIVSIHES